MRNELDMKNDKKELFTKCKITIKLLKYEWIIINDGIDYHVD